MLSRRRKQSVSPHPSPRHRHAQDEHKWFMFFTALELLSTAQSIGDAAACMRAFAPLFSSLEDRVRCRGGREYVILAACVYHAKNQTHISSECLL